MKAKAILLFSILALFLGSCSTADKATNKSTNDLRSEISKEIAALSSNSQKQQYLEQIHKDDQKYRGKMRANILSTYGEDSDENEEFLRAFKLMDSLNLIKVEEYLDKFGHPKKDVVGEYATTTPWLVVHHAYDYEAREKHFKTIYAAYLNGEINEFLMHGFIGRMYKMKNGKDFKYLSRNSLRKEMDMMMTDLGLQELIATTSE